MQYIVVSGDGGAIGIGVPVVWLSKTGPQRLRRKPNTRRKASQTGAPCAAQRASTFDERRWKTLLSELLKRCSSAVSRSQFLVFQAPSTCSTGGDAIVGGRRRFGAGTLDVVMEERDRAAESRRGKGNSMRVRVAPTLTSCQIRHVRVGRRAINAKNFRAQVLTCGNAEKRGIESLMRRLV